MKKIITLALAAVLTLGLAVLPQADAPKTAAQLWADQEAEVKEKEKDYKEAKKAYEDAVEATKAAKKAWEAKLDDNDKKDAYTKAVADEAKAKKDMDDKEVLYNAAKKALDKLDFAHVVLVDENDKVVAEGDVPAGHYTVKELLKHFDLDTKAFEYADMDEIKSIGGRYSKEVIKLIKKYPVMVRAIDEEGREIGTYEANTKKLARRGWVTANEVAAKELTFGEDTQKNLGVNGYWVLADVEENEKPQYVNTYTKGGEKYITAVYTVAKKAKMSKDGKVKNVTKPGQVGKTGEVATVATGLGALMTLAGVVVATKRH